MSSMISDNRYEDINELVRDQVNIKAYLYVGETRIARIEADSVESLEEELYKFDDAINAEVSSEFWDGATEIDYDELAKEERVSHDL